MASSTNPTEAQKVKDLGSKTGVTSGEKKAELSGTNKEGDAVKDLLGRGEVDTGVVPKSQQDAAAAIRAAHGEGDHKLQKLHEEKAEFKDDWGGDIETQRESGVKYSGRDEKPVPDTPGLEKANEMADQAKAEGKGPERAKKVIEEQEKNNSKL